MLEIGPGSRVVDATFGAGGHSRLIASLIGQSGTLVAFDRDASVFETTAAREIGALTRFTACVANFRDIKHTLAEKGIGAPDAVLADLGYSSTQIEESGRGFSFRSDEPLLMTYECAPSSDAVTAQTIVNTWSEETVRDILSGFADERYASRIAHAIVQARTKGEITTTAQLADIVTRATPVAYRKGRVHPATKTFQALRMAVNDELGAVDDLITDTLAILRFGGRLALITFHSVEDRLVKRRFRDLAEKGVVSLVTKRALKPSDAELADNPRARSAHLRVVMKT